MKSTISDIYVVSPKARFLLQFDSRRVTIIIQEHWTSRDVIRIFGAITYFGKFVRTVTVNSLFEVLMISKINKYLFIFEINVKNNA